MAFDQSTITDGPTITPDLDRQELHVSWASSDPAGTPFQLYIDGRLAKWSRRREIYIPWPHNEGVQGLPVVSHFQVGKVAEGEQYTDFSSSLPTPFSGAANNRATITWIGGTYLSAAIAGYKVFGSKVPFGPVDYTKPYKVLPLSIGGIDQSVLGYGPLGSGVIGSAGTAYTWTSPNLRYGTWSFEVWTFDGNGRLGTVQVFTFSSTAPPTAVTPFTDHKRLHKSYNAGTRQVTLTWQANP